LINIIKKYFYYNTIKNLIIVGLGSFGTAFFGLLLGITAARYLGPEEFGRYGYYISIFAIMSMFYTLGMDIYIVIQIAREPEKANKFITSNLINRSIAITIVSILFFIINIFIKIIPIELATIFFFISTILNSFETVTLGVYRAFEKMNYYSIFMISRQILTLVFFIGTAIFFKMRIEGIAISNFLALSLVISVSYFILIKRFNFIFSDVNKLDLIKLLKKSSPFFLNSIVAMLYMQVDTVMINRMIGDAETGYYNVAKQIMVAMLILPSIFNTILLPKMSRRNFDTSNNKVWLISLFIIGLIISFILFAFSGIIIKIFFGNDFIKSVLLLRILLWQLPLIFVNASLSTFLSAKDQQGKVLLINIMAILLNIPLNFIFIPVWGAAGAAFTTLICAVIAVMFYYIIYHKYKNKKEKVKG